ncbi:MAG: hypothetical protein O3C40_04475 [Planctomycetota bacterium]|nr:hypothetical protein [Planctomycetota bacterium]
MTTMDWTINITSGREASAWELSRRLRRCLIGHSQLGIRGPRANLDRLAKADVVAFSSRVS